VASQHYAYTKIVGTTAMEQEPDFSPIPQEIDNKGVPGGSTPKGISPDQVQENRSPTLPPPSWLLPTPPETPPDEVASVSNVKNMKPIIPDDQRSPWWYLSVTLFVVLSTYIATYLYLAYR
jgi:hypothetical protein